MKPILIFPQQPHEKCVDYAFSEEWDTAISVGFECFYVNIDSLWTVSILLGNKLPKYENVQPAIYRGWILRKQEYNIMRNHLKFNNNIELINNTYQYEVGQYLLHSLPHFKYYSIPSVLLEGSTSVSKSLLKKVFKQFGNSDIFLKDFIKSEPDNILVADDLDGDLVKIKKFVENRGKMFEGGLALRKFINLSDLETRLWVIRNSDGKNIVYNPAKIYIPPSMLKLIEAYKSNFFTVDITHDKETGFIHIVETGDGQVCGLKGLDLKEFYEFLIKIFE